MMETADYIESALCFSLTLVMGEEGLYALLELINGLL